MKYLKLIILILACVNSYGQRIDFHNNEIDTIIIKSNESSYHFTSRITKGKEHELKISFNEGKQSYERSIYQRCKYETGENINKIKTKKLRVSKQLERENLVRLIQILENNEYPTKSYAELNKNWLIININKPTLVKYAKKAGFDWYVSNDKETEKMLKDVISIDTLKQYFDEKFSINGYTMITDYSKNFRIIVKTETGSFHFEGKFPNSFLQPWYNHSSLKTNFVENVLMFEINQILEEILPKKFQNIKDLSTQEIIKTYLYWYFDRRFYSDLKQLLDEN